MWARNLLLLVVVVAGIAGLRASLFPLNTRERKIQFDSSATSGDDFQKTVRQLDEAFRKDWDERELTPVPQAEHLVVARRLSLALSGSVPSLEEIRQFEAQPADTRLAGWTNHLLHDQRYADYFAERLARAYVGTEDGPLLSFRKRRYLAWLSDEFHKNAPYGAIVREMIAGKGLNTDSPGVNFIAATYDEAKNKPDPEKLAIRVCRAFLGVRIDCAQCHDHFLEPAWKQADFQSIAAFFGQTRQVATHILDGEGEYSYDDRVHGGNHIIAPAVPFSKELLPDQGTRRERLAAWVTDPRNMFFARATANRVWAMMFGRPLLKRVEAQTLSEPIPPALEILAADFASHGHDLRRLILLIASTEVFRLDSAAPFEITDAHDEAWAVFPLSRLRPEQVIGNVIQASSVKTIDQNSHAITRLVRYFNEKDFVKRYGDADDDEFARAHGTIPQRLLMMNGDLVNGKTKEELLNAATHVAMLAADDKAAVESAYLMVLTRRPTEKESDYFIRKIDGSRGDERKRRLADIFWTLFNSSEMSWNH
jgi:hypothetical protein